MYLQLSYRLFILTRFILSVRPSVRPPVRQSGLSFRVRSLVKVYRRVTTQDSVVPVQRDI